jgi:uncharacterized protein with NRDE domain
MCVVTIAWRAHPRWHLIVAGNRDEFHGRPSAGIARWAGADHVIAGRDLQSGGSWIGVSEMGRFAVVTNLAGMGDPQANKASRGALIADFLTDGRAYAAAELDQFNPFNLFVASMGVAHFMTNGPSAISTVLSPGVHSLSNGIPEAPWPRKERMHGAMVDWLADAADDGAADDPAALLIALRDESDLGGDMPRPVFIRDDHYGTRCSTIIAVDTQGNGMITEHRFGPGGTQAGETREAFIWPISAID